MRSLIRIISFSALIVFLLWVVPIVFYGPRSVTALENIHGIPFPNTDQGILVSENLAHADISLWEPVVAKELHLTIAFAPETVKTLRVGVRENPFWLSYTPTLLYDSSQETTPLPSITKTIIIPLTDKLQDTDRSIDLMFFADDIKNPDAPSVSEWTLHALRAEVFPVLPSTASARDYIKSILRRERAL